LFLAFSIKFSGLIAPFLSVSSSEFKKSRHFFGFFDSFLAIFIKSTNKWPRNEPFLEVKESE